MISVLIVEDSLIFRDTLSGLLRSFFPSITVIEASETQDALDKVRELQPDIIFVDIHLFGESGLEITREIRKKYSDIVIVILTSNDLYEYRKRAMRNGANGFISKGSVRCMEDILSCVERVQIARKHS